MLSSLSYTSTVFMSLVCIHSLQALHIGILLASMGYITPKLTLNSRTKQPHTEKQQKKTLMSPMQFKTNVTSPPVDNVCLLGNFERIIAAQAERLVVGLGCMWESSQQTAHLR